MYFYFLDRAHTSLIPPKAWRTDFSLLVTNLIVSKSAISELQTFHVPSQDSNEEGCYLQQPEGRSVPESGKADGTARGGLHKLAIVP